MKFDAKETAMTGMICAFTIILSYIEVLIPFSIGIPGIKLGIANIGIITALYAMSYRNAYIINIIRILTIALLFGNIYTFAFSIAGGMLSLTVMSVLKKSGKFHLVTISIMGGVFHNLGQLVTAYLIIRRTSVFYYLPAMIIAGIITGFIIGIVTLMILNINYFRKGQKNDRIY